MKLFQNYISWGSNKNNFNLDFQLGFSCVAFTFLYVIKKFNRTDEYGHNFKNLEQWAFIELLYC